MILNHQVWYKVRSLLYCHLRALWAKEELWSLSYCSCATFGILLRYNCVSLAVPSNLWELCCSGWQAVAWGDREGSGLSSLPFRHTWGYSDCQARGETLADFLSPIPGWLYWCANVSLGAHVIGRWGEHNADAAWCMKYSLSSLEIANSSWFLRKGSWPVFTAHSVSRPLIPFPEKAKLFSS